MPVHQYHSWFDATHACPHTHACMHACGHVWVYILMHFENLYLYYRSCYCDCFLSLECNCQPTAVTGIVLYFYDCHCTLHVRNLCTTRPITNFHYDDDTNYAQQTFDPQRTVNGNSNFNTQEERKQAVEIQQEKVINDLVNKRHLLSFPEHCLCKHLSIDVHTYQV